MTSRTWSSTNLAVQVSLPIKTFQIDLFCLVRLLLWLLWSRFTSSFNPPTNILRQTNFLAILATEDWEFYWEIVDISFHRDMAFGCEFIYWTALLICWEPILRIICKIPWSGECFCKKCARLACNAVLRRSFKGEHFWNSFWKHMINFH